MRRYATLVGVGATAITVAGLMTGCASSRSILYSGVSGPAGQSKTVVTDSAALHDARLNHAQWVTDITGRAREDPGQRFANLSTREFRLRLAKAAARYHFSVKQVQFLHPRQVAPLVIIQTRRYLAVAHAIPAIEKSLDPHTGHNDQRGWAFEAFFLEAQDERGVPFIVVSNFLRGTGPGGGQWARSDQLYPFAHG
jgi:hypothetical protein